MNFPRASSSSTVPVVPFILQGLEKLNDLTTKYFHSASNHCNIENLKQILQKQNHLESLEDWVQMHKADTKMHCL